MLEQRSDSLQLNTAQSQARVMSLEQEKVCKNMPLPNILKVARVAIQGHIDKPKNYSKKLMLKLDEPMRS